MSMMVITHGRTQSRMLNIHVYNCVHRDWPFISWKRDQH